MIFFGNLFKSSFNLRQTKFFWEACKRGFPGIDSAEQFISSSFAHFSLFINGFRNPFSDKNWLSFNEFRCFWVNWVTILFFGASFGFNLSFQFFFAVQRNRPSLEKGSASSKNLLFIFFNNEMSQGFSWNSLKIISHFLTILLQNKLQGCKIISTVENLKHLTDLGWYRFQNSTTARDIDVKFYMLIVLGKLEDFMQHFLPGSVHK